MSIRIPFLGLDFVSASCITDQHRSCPRFYGENDCFFFVPFFFLSFFFFLPFFLSFLVHVCECVKVRTNVSIGVVEMKYLEKLRARCCGLRNQVIASSKGKVRKSYNCSLQAMIVFNAQLYLGLIRKIVMGYFRGKVL